MSFLLILFAFLIIACINSSFSLKILYLIPDFHLLKQSSIGANSGVFTAPSTIFNLLFLKNYFILFEVE